MQFSFHFRTKVPSVYAKGTKYLEDNQIYLDFCFHKSEKDTMSSSHCRISPHCSIYVNKIYRYVKLFRTAFLYRFSRF